MTFPMQQNVPSVFYLLHLKPITVNQGDYSIIHVWKRPAGWANSVFYTNKVARLWVNVYIILQLALRWEKDFH